MLNVLESIPFNHKATVITLKLNCSHIELNFGNPILADEAVVTDQTMPPDYAKTAAAVETDFGPTDLFHLM